MAMQTDPAQALASFYEEIKDCRRCALAGGRTRLVFGSGDATSDVVFVGEAPGHHEDQQGLPFVGAAGKLLDELLASISLRREKVYIANVLKCRPPENRDPTAEEIELCQPYLSRQLEIISPRVVCTMGNFATQLIAGKRTGISRLRGQPIQVGKFFAFPIYHPAAALHRGDLLAPLREDFLALKRFLASAAVPEPRAEQMDLL